MTTNDGECEFLLWVCGLIGIVFFVVEADMHEELKWVVGVGMCVGYTALLCTLACFCHAWVDTGSTRLH